ncbi:uncharacterized protein [Henckelia pumila]|uniref:uncharacterized protein n=1 Tax=Henckelia pumila TaxID=405737 RepID=UPI003C6E936C
MDEEQGDSIEKEVKGDTKYQGKKENYQVEFKERKIWILQKMKVSRKHHGVKSMDNECSPFNGLLEPRVSGSHADDICKKMGPTGALVYYIHCLCSNLCLDGPWCSIGDYNSVISDEEVSQIRKMNHRRNVGFSEWIFNQDLIDMGYVGSKFTWIRGLSSNTYKGARLDRGVCNVDWKKLFPEAKVIHLPILQSDHEPLLVKLKDKRSFQTKGVFRFQAAWITHGKSGLSQEIETLNSIMHLPLFEEEEIGLKILKMIEKDSQCDLSTMQRGLFPRLSKLKTQYMNSPFSMEEIKKSLFDMAPLKAPGPDGFHAAFYQHSWALVNKSLCALVFKYLDTGIIPEGVNDTLLTLIPKVTSPEFIYQFGPISLFNVSYKIITKVMTIRLKNIMTDIIGPFQSSFVPNRQITDNILIYQEVLNSIKRKKGAK